MRIIVLDPVLASRFLLAQAASQPGFLIETAATVAEARAHLDRHRVSLILCEHALREGDGLDFLTDLRGSHPETGRALVTEQAGLGFMREAIARGGLSFLVRKPWSADTLRRTIVEALGVQPEIGRWTQLRANERREFVPEPAVESTRPPASRQEILLRGLLAGLNSCESQAEAFELFHSELAEQFRIDRWLWIDEQNLVGIRVSGDWPAERAPNLGRLSRREARLLDGARQSHRVTRLRDDEEVESDRLVCLSISVKDAGVRTLTGLVWADRSRARELVLILRELHAGLQMAMHRIRDADRRAEAARRLAERVSTELRTPVGALTHAIDRLRGEVERAGMPTEWVDRVCSESQRVARAVEDLEGEMHLDPSRMVSPSS